MSTLLIIFCYFAVLCLCVVYINQVANQRIGFAIVCYIDVICVKMCSFVWESRRKIEGSIAHFGYFKRNFKDQKYAMVQRRLRAKANTSNATIPVFCGTIFGEKEYIYFENFFFEYFKTFHILRSDVYAYLDVNVWMRCCVATFRTLVK